MASLSKSVSIKAARIAGRDRAMDQMASRVESLVIGAAANHRDSGDFIDSIQSQSVTGPRGVTDRRVFSEDPAALAKEFGHTTPAGTWVPGIHAFGQALGQAKRG